MKRLLLVVVLLLMGMTVPAAAEPATSIGYPASATATRYKGLAFDTCTAPTVAQMSAWLASPYRAVGIYFGGVNRGCAQPQLTGSWVRSVARMGWRLIPVYMGYQAPCTTRPSAVKLTASSAATQGTAQAADAAAKAAALGILPGSALYGDMEHYNVNDATCRAAVLRYLSSWTKELHRRGYISAVYAHQDSGARHLAEVYNSTSYARPDAVWIARWNHSSTLTGWPLISDRYWSVGQRAKQYEGDHNETYGGVTLNIDNDRFDAPVASTWYTYTVRTDIYAYSGPSTAYPRRATIAHNAAIRIVCQTFGPKIGTSAVWDKLIDGSYVTDYYVRTPGNPGYSAPIPGCSLPYQTTTDNLARRHGPGTSYASYPGLLPIGSLAWVTCQRAGTKVGTTAVWNRLSDGTWVTDYYVANPSNTTYSAPIRRC
jgi:uncharacterized protein YraI